MPGANFFSVVRHSEGEEALDEALTAHLERVTRKRQPTTEDEEALVVHRSFEQEQRPRTPEVARTGKPGVYSTVGAETLPAPFSDAFISGSFGVQPPNGSGSAHGNKERFFSMNEVNSPRSEAEEQRTAQLEVAISEGEEEEPLVGSAQTAALKAKLKMRLQEIETEQLLEEMRQYEEDEEK